MAGHTAQRARADRRHLERTLAATPELQLPRLVVRAAEQIHRAAASLAPHWAENAAVLIVSSGEIRDGLRALPVLEQLRELHQPVAIPDHWNSGVTDIEVCNHCRTAWPCDDAVILGVAE